MKRKILILLSALTVFALMGCGNKGSEETTAPSVTETPAPVLTETPTPVPTETPTPVPNPNLITWLNGEQYLLTFPTTIENHLNGDDLVFRSDLYYEIAEGEDIRGISGGDVMLVFDRDTGEGQVDYKNAVRDAEVSADDQINDCIAWYGAENGKDRETGLYKVTSAGFDIRTYCFCDEQRDMDVAVLICYKVKYDDLDYRTEIVMLEDLGLDNFLRIEYYTYTETEPTADDIYKTAEGLIVY